ncbi:MAG: aminopeptidase P N-terminal domain-containing protein, partial [Chitinophagaceae bacterium]
MFRLFITVLFLVIFNGTNAQGILPTDYLSNSFHKERRDALRKLMPPNSVAVIFAYPERVFSRDVNYAYHPNPDLYYFSGYKEPNAVLLIFKDKQTASDGPYDELFFVRKRNPQQEQWTGRRLGVEGVKQQLGINKVYHDEEFAKFPIDFTRFSKIFYDDFPDDIGPGMQLSLINTFKTRAGIKHYLNKNIIEDYNIILHNTTPYNLPSRINRFKTKMSELNDESYNASPILKSLIDQPDSATLAKVKAEIQGMSLPTMDYNRLVGTLREIKTAEEIGLLRKSVFLSAVAHTEVMKAIHPDMSETELMGIFEYIHKKYGAEGEGYPPIVGAGANGCILHYIENNITQVNNQLVLMDVASEYHGYSADITRTVPANGKFTPAQSDIYQLVYEAQEEVFKLCKEGTPFKNLNIKATEVLAAGLLNLGIINDLKDVSRYYIHSCSHHMGLDVHDKFASSMLKENMVI